MLQKPVQFSANPSELLRAAIRAVPAVKYALGIGGVMGALALGKVFFSSTSAALFGTVVMLILMTLLVIFAALVKIGFRQLQLLAFVLAWFVLLLFILCMTCLFSATFLEIGRASCRERV